MQLPQDSPLSIPGKLYEYMLFDAWLLVLGRIGVHSDAAMDLGSIQHLVLQPVLPGAGQGAGDDI